MKVYVITKGAYSDYHICGVSLDKKTAEQIAERLTTEWGDAEVETYDTEEYSQVLKGGNAYRIRLLEDDKVEVSEDADLEWCMPYINKVEKMWKNLGIYTFVIAEDEDHARKIGTDILYQYKYEKETYGRTIYDKQ